MAALVLGILSILTAQLFVVLVLTALLATALTGPLLSLTERYPARRAPTVHSGWRWVQVDREAS